MAQQGSTGRSVLIRAVASIVFIPTAAIAGPGMVAGASASTTPTAYRASIVAGREGVADGGSALNSNIDSGDVVVSPSGDVYLADGGHVDRISPNGTISVVAGVVGFSPPAGVTNIVPVAGPALDSPMDPTGLALDAAGNLYISDGLGFIDKVTPDGTLSIVAGIGKSQVYDSPVPGPATSSPISPGGIAVDPSGNVFFADWPGYILKVTPAGVLSIVTSESQLASQPSGTVQAVTLGSLAMDPSGNLYVTDIAASRTTGYIFKVTPGGTVSIVAGNGAPENGAVSSSATAMPILPSGVAVDPTGNLYIATSNSTSSGQLGRILKVTPSGSASVVAGSPGFGPTKPTYPPVPGPATSSPMSPVAIALDSSGSLYVSDSGFSNYGAFVEKVTSDGTLSVIAGTTSNSVVAGPAVASAINAADIAADPAGNLYIADPAGYIEKVSTTGALSFIAGSGDTNDPPAPGAASSSPMSPSSVAVGPSGSLYVGDSRGYILKITSAGVLSILIGPGAYAAPITTYGQPTYPTLPSGIAVDSAGNVFVSDFGGYVEKLTPAGVFSIAAGEGSDGPAGPTVGPTPTSTLLVHPMGVAVDSAGDFYVAAACDVFKVTPDASISLVPGTSTSHCFQSAPDVAVDQANNIYITEDQGFVERVASDGSVSTIAGTPSTQPPTATGWATARTLNPDPISVDGSGSVYVVNRHTPDMDIVKLAPTSATSPSAPTNVSATPGSSSAKVTFTPSLDTGGLTVTGYTVSDGVGDTCSPTTLTVYGTGNTSCTITGLTPGTSYTFTVTATNAAGTSGPSNASNAVTPYTLAGAPTGVTGTAKPASVELSWTAPSFDGWSSIYGYTVTATDTAQPNNPFAVCPDALSSNATHCTATGLVNGENYTFTVAAENAAGTGPKSSASQPITPVDVPSAPNSTMITAGDSSLTPIWYSPSDNGSPITSYTATAQPSGATCTTPGNGPPNRCTITGLTNGVTYSVTVTATNAIGTSPAGNPVSATPQPSPPPAVSNTATPAITGIPRVGARLTVSPGSWSVSDATYQYQWLADGIAISGATAATFVPTAAQLGKVLTVSVTASRSGYSASSATSPATSPIARGVITNRTLPSIRGTLRVGSILRATSGSWRPGGLTIRYQWLMNGKPIAGARSNSLRLARVERGKRIRVKVRVLRAGYRTAYRYSAPTAYVR